MEQLIHAAGACLASKLAQMAMGVTGPTSSGFDGDAMWSFESGC